MDDVSIAAESMTDQEQHDAPGDLAEDRSAVEQSQTDGPDVPERDSPQIHPRRVVEAILMAADSPLPAAKIAAILSVGDARDVKAHVEALNGQYAQAELSFRIEHVAGGYQILTLPAYNTWLAKLLRARQETKLSPAAMETLAIVAYKQPCTRADVEAIRGVAAGDLLNRLREINLIKIVGRAEDLGRPLLYGTTKHFLEVFGLPSLEDLPQVEAFRSAAAGPSKPQDPHATGAPSSPETAEPPEITDPDNDEESVALEDADAEDCGDPGGDGDDDTAADAPKLSLVNEANEPTAR